MPDKSVSTIDLPVQPKDVFRLLALRSITENDDLIKKLLDNFDSIYNGIEMTPRLDRDAFGRNVFGYKHEGLDVQKTVFTDMTERQLCAAKQAFYADTVFNGIGRVLDYELPLDDKKNSAFGKVDLVSQVNDELFLLEVKKCESNEHPLRAMFEIFTFWKTLSDEAGGFKVFIDAYFNSHTYQKRKGGLHKPTKVHPGLLLCKTSKIYEALLSSSNGNKNGEGLYKRFLQPPIGLRVFTYSRDNLDVEEVTTDLKERFGVG